MSKRQEIRQRRQREKTRNRLLIVLLVVGGALFIALALILPGIQQTKNANATATQVAASPVIVITPEAINAPINGTSMGDPNAPVKVDVYEDFRCSACKFYSQNIEPLIIQNYVDLGKVLYSYHTFIVIDSFDNSGASDQAANAALCAADQGHFWEYHNTLFANQITEDASLFSNERLVTMAQNVNLDMTAFNQCFQEKRFSSTIQADISKGQSLGITGTPSVFVDGTLVSDINKLTTAIDTALAGK
jgi:protein-disulfide isomerase